MALWSTHPVLASMIMGIYKFCGSFLIIVPDFSVTYDGNKHFLHFNHSLVLRGKSVRQLAIIVALLYYKKGIHRLSGTSQHSYNRWQGISTKLVETSFIHIPLYYFSSWKWHKMHTLNLIEPSCQIYTLYYRYICSVKTYNSFLADGCIFFTM